MKFCFGITLLTILCAASGQQRDAIIRNDFEGPNPDGSYRWAIQTQGGIYHEQRAAAGAALVEGQLQYTAPDGQIIKLLYTADENGFHPVGDHLPTPPPIPPAIQRSLDYIASLQRH